MWPVLDKETKENNRFVIDAVCPFVYSLREMAGGGLVDTEHDDIIDDVWWTGTQAISVLRMVLEDVETGLWRMDEEYSGWTSKKYVADALNCGHWRDTKLSTQTTIFGVYSVLKRGILEAFEQPLENKQTIKRLQDDLVVFMYCQAKMECVVKTAEEAWYKENKLDIYSEQVEHTK